LTLIINEIKEGNTHIQTWITSVKQHVLDIEDTSQASGSNIVDLKKQVEQLKMHLDDRENRSRCNNLWFLGFLEDVEQGNPVKFLQKTLPMLLQLSTDTIVEIEQAHCLLAPEPAPEQCPRLFAVCFLRFPLKEKMFLLAHDAGKLEWKEHHIQIFPDLLKDLQDRRCQFMQVKKKLCDLGIRYGLYYPVVLQISVDGKQHSFSTPGVAEEFLSEWERHREGKTSRP
uniref:L1 transposable element RRM domain-containing protein n=1 Tax=Latimeria chalumnae TaxID=7897 RepID=H3ACL8_LATCH